jgi:Tfp pilus assembly protein PilO
MMKISSNTTAVLRSRSVLVGVGVGLVVLLIWLVAFFLPQGKDLSKYQTQQRQLQAQQSQLELQLAQLRATSKATPKLLALDAQYTGLIPPTDDIYNYIKQMSSTVMASGEHLVSITPSNVGSPVPGTSLYAIPIALNTMGTYDSTLALIKAIYGMPRLTVINSMSISGGGPLTNRGTTLTENFALTIYTTAKPATP